MTANFRPRRSVLYMPGSNARALEKARGLPADGLIMDLEDAVAPSEKAQARQQVLDAVNAESGYDGSEVVVRINALDSEWGNDDLQSVLSANAGAIDAVLLPKVERAEQIIEVAEQLPDGLKVWAMIETPLAVIQVEQICRSHPKLAVLVMGTSDLAKDLRIPHTPKREGFLYSLSKCVLAARAYGLDIIDGVHLQLEDDRGFVGVCEQGRELGFDGKSLIHPKQITAANRFFAPNKGMIIDAHEVIDAWENAEKAGRGVVVLNGKLVENLHVEEAKRILAVEQAIAKRENREAL